jgi:hypothetical protein
MRFLAVFTASFTKMGRPDGASELDGPVPAVVALVAFVVVFAAEMVFSSAIIFIPKSVRKSASTSLNRTEGASTVAY